jgi:hypothetical protein
MYEEEVVKDDEIERLRKEIEGEYADEYVHVCVYIYTCMDVYIYIYVHNTDTCVNTHSPSY